MVSIILCLKALLLVLILKKANAASDQCRKLQEEIDGLDRDITNTTFVKHNVEEQAGRCEVSDYCNVHLPSLLYSYM